jgi:diacylglycerol O-acyltransferase / wax synthase
MSLPHYDRLSSLDASFFALEDKDSPMHVGSITTFEAAPLRTADGGLDFQRIERALMKIFPEVPRLYQRIWWPAGGPPVWIDDPGFDPSYHFRYTALPSPGTLDQLRSLCGRILSSRLDTRRPLWEAWIIEGLEGDRFALAWKLHHSLADGIGVRDILLGYLGLEPSTELPKLPAYCPRPAPTLRQLALDSARHRVEKTREVSERLNDFLLHGPTLREALVETANGLVQAASNLLTSVSPTPLNGTTGPHRRFDFTSCEFRVLNDIRKHTGAKINDIALSVVGGAVRSFLLGKKLRVDELDFRIMCPVNMRSDRDRPGLGNRVASMDVPMPLFETDPRRRLQRTIEATTRAKASGQSRIVDLIALASDWAGLLVPQPLARLAAERISANLVVTNVPGPQFTMYLLESQMLESFPVVPLSGGQGLGIALFGYNQNLYWGFNADRDLLPDVGDFVKAVDRELADLHRAYNPIPIRKLRAVEGGSAARTRGVQRAR